MKRKHIASIRSLGEKPGPVFQVWVCLIEMAWRSGSSIITPTRAEIMAVTGIKYAGTISRALTSLHEAGWIERSVSHFRDGPKMSSALKVVISRPSYANRPPSKPLPADPLAMQIGHLGREGTSYANRPLEHSLTRMRGRSLNAGRPRKGGPATTTPKPPPPPTPPQPEEPLCIGLSPIVLKFQEAQKRAQEAQGSTQGGGGV